MPFTGEQSRSGIEADPSRSGKVNLRPCVKVSDVNVRPLWTIQRLNVRGELNQIAGNESRSQPEVTKQLHQQPRAIAAGAAAKRQGLLRRLNAGLDANQ